MVQICGVFSALTLSSPDIQFAVYASNKTAFVKIVPNGHTGATGKVMVEKRNMN